MPSKNLITQLVKQRSIISVLYNNHQRGCIGKINEFRNPAQRGVHQPVRKGKVRHRVPTMSWVRTLGKSSPPIGESRRRLRISRFPEGARHRRL